MKKDSIFRCEETKGNCGKKKDPEEHGKKHGETARQRKNLNRREKNFFVEKGGLSSQWSFNWGTRNVWLHQKGFSKTLGKKRCDKEEEISRDTSGDP